MKPRGASLALGAPEVAPVQRSLGVAKRGSISSHAARLLCRRPGLWLRSPAAQSGRATGRVAVCSPCGVQATGVAKALLGRRGEQEHAVGHDRQRGAASADRRARGARLPHEPLLDAWRLRGRPQHRRRVRRELRSPNPNPNPNRSPNPYPLPNSNPNPNPNPHPNQARAMRSKPSASPPCSAF